MFWSCFPLFNSFESLPSPYLPTLSTLFQEKNKKKWKKWKSNQTKTIRQKMLKQKALKKFVLCWLTSPGHGAFPGVWLICTVALHWRKLTFLIRGGTLCPCSRSPCSQYTYPLSHDPAAPHPVAIFETPNHTAPSHERSPQRNPMEPASPWGHCGYNIRSNTGKTGRQLSHH